MDDPLCDILYAGGTAASREARLSWVTRFLYPFFDGSTRVESDKVGSTCNESDDRELLKP
jgi:hypothetical protein